MFGTRLCAQEGDWQERRSSLSSFPTHGFTSNGSCRIPWTWPPPSLSKTRVQIPAWIFPSFSPSIPSFTHLSNHYMLSTYYVPDNIPGTRDTATNKTDNKPSSPGVYVPITGDRQ